MTAARDDRIAGTLVGLACGDALGAPYEFHPALVRDEPIGMIGGGGFGWQPGEWTDDTSMALVIAQAIVDSHLPLSDPVVHDAIVDGWVEWARTAKDVGSQTRAVLSSVASTPTASSASASARALHERTGRSAGNGSLMRTAPVALAYLDDPDQLDAAARAISALTHYDSEAGEACALWCHAIAHAVNYGTFDGLRAAVDQRPADRARIWNERLDLAESVEPHEIPGNNGWVVAALMAAWSAITRTPIPHEQPGRHLALAIERAVRCGNDTDTVAAIAGSLLGARWGVSAVPLAWQRVLHGWPGLRYRDLIALAFALDNPKSIRAEVFDYSGYGDLHAMAIHPHDEKVLLGAVGVLRELPVGITAVVSLCRLGSTEVPAQGVTIGNHVEVWLIDKPEPADNPNLDLALTNAADTIAALRSEGHTVLVHCVQAQSRTPTVAALYSARHLQIPADQALAAVVAALPAAHPNAAFRAAIKRLAAS
ncbi:MAG: ADP-ribosylglycohydrolase family protein [Actinomycetes bacterium]